MHKDIYASPRVVKSADDCDFYHTMDIPGHGLIKAQWDLRQKLPEYLGNVDFKGKRVLEVGTADGFLSFHMENQGAQVVGYDLSENESWDVVPYSRYNFAEIVAERKAHIRRLNNAYWFCHRAFSSNAKVVYGTVYDIPPEIGPVDISTFGAVLLHVRDPFLALQNALRLTKETVIITEPIWWLGWRMQLVRKLANMFMKSYMIFVPNYETCAPSEMWWVLSPKLVKRFIGVLGFEDAKVTYHSQKHEPYRDRRLVPFYTIVGHRTQSCQAR